jgi:hypothetical protein
VVAGYAISPVGSLYTGNGTGLTTLSVNPTTIGDCLIFAPTHGATGSTITSVTGGHCASWTRIAGPFTASGYSATVEEIWVGVCNAIGSAANITIAGASLGSSSQRLVARQFTTGQGAASTWIADGSPANFEQDSTASATLNWPTLTPTGTNRMYLGRGSVGSTANTTGQTSGYTVSLDAGSNPFFYNPSVANSAQSPTCTQATANHYTISAVLVYSPVLESPGQFLPFFNHHEDELERRPSGLYVQRKVFGYRGAGRDSKVLVRSAR